MSRLDRRIHDVIRLVAYLRQHPGAELGAVTHALGLERRAVLELIGLATLCGKHPFGPDDLVEIYVDDGERIHLVLDQDLGRPLRFTFQEAVALAVSLRGALASGRESHWETVHTALDKLKAHLSHEVGEKVAEVETRIAVEPDGDGLSGRFSTLFRALEARRAVDIEYYAASRDEMTSRRVSIYALIQHLGYWYAVGYDALRDDIRIFKVERMKDVRATDEPYEIPATFKSEEYKKDDLFFGEQRMVRVRCRPPLDRYVEEEWDPENVERLEDGSVVVRFPYVHPEGAACAVLGYGPRAEVLEPDEVRDVLARIAQEARALYDVAPA